MEDEIKMPKFRNKTIIISIVFLSFIIALYMWGMPLYKVYSLELMGKAQLKQAEWNRQINIKEAEARLASAKLDKLSEVVRAEGVAEANEIIGTSLKGNEAYLRYLWINGLHDGSSEIIYVPTEANLPILEATRGIRE